MQRSLFLKDTQLRVLKTMSEATIRMDLNMFANAVSLAPNDAIIIIQQLTKEGYLQKSGTAYSLTEKGKSALKMSMQVPEDKNFCFYVDIDKPLGFSARSIEEFYRIIKKIISDSVEFHMYRGDFESWLCEVIGDKELAQDLLGIRTANVHGENLRKSLIKAFDSKYDIDELR